MRAHAVHNLETVFRYILFLRHVAVLNSEHGESVTSTARASANCCRDYIPFKMCNSRHVRNIPKYKNNSCAIRSEGFDENRARKRQERTLSRDHRHGSKPRTSRACFHHTIKDIHRTHAWERQRSLLVRRSFTPVTAFVGEEGQPTKQRAVLCTSETLVHNLKVGVFNRCLKLFSVFCLSVTTSRGTVDAGESEHQVRRAHLIPTTGARNAEE